jgi:hypothetical protein
MIKRALYSLLLVAMTLMTSCREKAIIPDDTLADIFHDAFIVNSYIGEERINLDSLHVYEPIFQRYGYTAADVVHTVGNFSRRKSVRLGSIVEAAIAKLEKEGRELEKKVVILDTIRNVAIRTFKRTIYSDSLIVAKNRADSTKLHIEVSPAPRGEYIILYTYACGDDLEKYPRNAELYFVDENGYNRNRITFAMRDKGSVNRTVIAKENNNKLVLNIGKYGNYTSKENKITPPKTQDLKITNLKIMHKYNEVDAVDSLFKRYVDVKIFVDGFLIKKDSLALSADAAGVSTSTASND